MKTYNELNEYSTDELCEIYNNLNSWRWDERVGEKPDNFDKLPKYNVHWWHKLFKRKTKSDYLVPVIHFLYYILPRKDYLYWKNVKKRKTMTDEQFERFWRTQTENCHSSSLWL